MPSGVMIDRILATIVPHAGYDRYDSSYHYDIWRYDRYDYVEYNGNVIRIELRSDPHVLERDR